MTEREKELLEAAAKIVEDDAYRRSGPTDRIMYDLAKRIRALSPSAQAPSGDVEIARHIESWRNLAKRLEEENAQLKHELRLVSPLAEPIEPAAALRSYAVDVTDEMVERALVAYFEKYDDIFKFEGARDAAARDMRRALLAALTPRKPESSHDG